MAILSDYLVYSHRPRGFNFAELYRRTEGDKLDDFDRTLLGHMSAALYTILKVDAAFPEKEELMVSDLLLNTPRRLCDRDLSLSAQPDMQLASHILVFDDFCMLTGAALPFNGELATRDPATMKVLHELDNPIAAMDPGLRSRFAWAYIAVALKNHDSQRLRSGD